MKNKWILILLFLTLNNLYSQTNQTGTNPSLSVGLETLTFREGTIDVEALRRVLIRKQNEIKREGVKRLILSTFPNYNYTSKLFLEKTVTTILDEKNQDIIEKEVLELATNYALIIGFSGLYKEVNKNNENTYAYKFFKQFEIDSSDINRKNGNQLFMDIVGTALSSNKLLNKKGFFDFDSKLDYTESNLYLKIGKQIDKSLNDNLIVEINKTISAYLKSYRYIEDILKNENYSKFDNVEKYYLSQIGDDFFNDNSLFIEYGERYNNSDLINIVGIRRLMIDLKNNIKNYNNSIVQLKSLTKSKKLDITENNYLVKFGDTIIESKEKKEVTNILRKNKLKIQTYINEFHKVEKLQIEINKLLREIKNNYLIVVANDNSSFVDFKTLTKSQLNLLNKYRNNNGKIDSLYRTINKRFKEIEENEKVIKNEIIRELGKMRSISLKYKFNYISNSLAKLNEEDLSPYLKKIDSTEREIKNNTVKNSYFIKQILGDISEKFLSENFNNKDSLFIRENADFFADLYVNTRNLSKKKDFSINDVLYLENEVMPKLVKAKILINEDDNDKIIDEIIKASNNIIPLIKFALTPDEIEHLTLNENIKIFLDFISKIDKLDKADTFTYILQLLDRSHNYFLETIGCNQKLLDKGIDKSIKSKEKRYCDFIIVYEEIINDLEKYTIINNEKDVIEIDVLSMLNSLIERFNKEKEYSKNSIYFTLGFSQNIFLSDFVVNSDDEFNNLSSIGFASEKIGYKYKFKSFKNKRIENLPKPGVISENRARENNPFINQWYGIIYGSGLLYSIANLTTNENFNFPHVGVGTGVRFYNSLDVNLNIGFPFIDDQNFGNNVFIGISLDIPITEYLSAISKN